MKGKGANKMKKVIIPISVYLIVNIVILLLPVSEGYESITWRLFIGQIYAIPALILSIVISYLIFKKTT